MRALPVLLDLEGPLMGVPHFCLPPWTCSLIMSPAIDSYETPIPHQRLQRTFNIGPDPC